MTTHPRLVALLATVVLVPLAIDDLKSLPASSPAVQAFNAYQAHFKDAAQVKVILDDPGHDLRQAQYSHAIAQVATALSQVEYVTGVQAPTTLLRNWYRNNFSQQMAAR